MKTIPLTRGYFTKVDDEDYVQFASMRWHVQINPRYPEKARAVRKNSKRETFYLSREILKAPKGKDVDHINGDTLDNQKKNLRLCHHFENQMNRGAQKNNTSGFKGVSWDNNKQKWVAQIKVQNRHLHLGRFLKREEAAKAYNLKAKECFGEFASLNFAEAIVEEVAK